ncbi:protein decapping 5 [Citrus sinensis]|uniref:Protein decapping 5 n=1 Tax=Citrus sinensis TaxID=2711 RepID=A0ACB8K3K1_CITSI|nr:protein decapping 5 [Citrus sinensis]
MSCGALVVAEASGCGGDGVPGAEEKHSKAKESLDFDDAETVPVAAATEAPRSSSSGSADSYIGSLISLTSKSEIRYEGVLFNINTEESSIGLRNVRSFGTEGRRKDGPQVPPSDKIYEYILFRGSDIKDLQVKSSPPVQTTTSIHNDPAIIQSHYSQAAIASTSLPSGTGSLPDPTSQTSQLGLSRPPFQGNPPLYQPGGSLGAWGSSPMPTTNGAGLAMPMYWQGFYGSPNGLQGQQQPLLQPPPGLSMLPSMQQSMQYPAMNPSLPTGVSNLPASQLAEHRPPLMPPISTGTLNLLSPMLPAQSSAMISDSSTNLIPDKASTQTLPTAAPSTSLPLVPPLNSGIDKTAVAPVSEPKSVPGPIMPFQSTVSESVSTVGMSSSILNDGIMPSLVTPGQLLQPGLPAVSSSQSSQAAQKDVEVVQLSSSESAAAPPPASDVQEPILPLPSTTERKPYGAPTSTQYGYRGGRGRGRGRGNELSRSATRFTEDFDFIAMNEKFNKDEVWGHLGKSNKALDDGDNYEDEEDVGSSKHENKPVYVKDDFFDSLSCDALNSGSHNGRPRFSEQVRRDTETFGDFPRYHGGRGGRGAYRGGRSRGSYHGRGYGYAPRGRGYGYGMSRTS